MSTGYSGPGVEPSSYQLGSMDAEEPALTFDSVERRGPSDRLGHAEDGAHDQHVGARPSCFSAGVRSPAVKGILTGWRAGWLRTRRTSPSSPAKLSRRTGVYPLIGDELADIDAARRGPLASEDEVQSFWKRLPVTHLTSPPCPAKPPAHAR